MPIFEVEPNEIAALADDALRVLIADLCRAELRAAGLPRTDVTAGGAQDAADGGVDVRVSTIGPLLQDGLLRRGPVGLQVKKPDLGPAAVGHEMRPNEQLRPSIKDLIGAGGTYVIASSGANAADSRLKARHDAMRQAVAIEDPAGSLRLVYLDRSGIADWTNTYPGAALSVKEKLGDPRMGWRGYGTWSHRGEDDPYAIADEATAFLPRQKEPTDVGRAIGSVRAALRRPNQLCRLIGLAGVGKTRFAEALFEEGVGEEPLDKSEAIYVDAGTDYTPTVDEMVRRLAGEGRRAIIIVDNCSPSQHRAIGTASKESGSRSSILTIEYDVRDDEPQETDVYRLAGTAEEALFELLARRFPALNQNDRRRAARASWGNARIAIWMAEAISAGGGGAGVSDADLFSRLFDQRSEEDAHLRQSARVAALAYSFDAETVSGNEAELPLLASLADCSEIAFSRHVAELTRRHLAQARLRWRAVLPQPLAYKLAAEAVDDLPPPMFEREFFVKAPDRLKQSVCRQLGNLHDHSATVELATRLLGAEGVFGTLHQAEGATVRCFVHLAPAAPIAALEAIERLVTAQSAGGEDETVDGAIRSVLLSLAYDPDLFERAVFALVRIDRTVWEGDRSDTPFDGLFRLALSGTQAEPSVRASVAEKLARSADPVENRAAVAAMVEMMTMPPFSGGRSFEFGSRSRSYGYEIRSGSRLVDWFSAAAAAAKTVVREVGGEEAQMALAAALPPIIGRVDLPSDFQLAVLGSVARLAADGEWPAAWQALMQCRRRRGENEAVGREIEQVLQLLAPTTFAERLLAEAGAREFSTLDPYRPFHAMTADERREERAGTGEDIAALGANVDDADLTDGVLDLLVSGRIGRAFEIGKGLAMGARDRRSRWEDLVAAWDRADRERGRFSVLIGYLVQVAEVDPPLVNSLLDEALDDPRTSDIFPSLQDATKLDTVGAQRLIRAAQKPGALPHLFEYLALGRRLERIGATDAVALISAIEQLEGGPRVALHLLSMLVPDREEADVPKVIGDYGRHLLARYDGSPDDDRRDTMFEYYLSTTAEAVFGVPAYVDFAYAAFVRELERSQDHYFSWLQRPSYARSLMAIYPTRMLDVLIDGTIPEGHAPSLFSSGFGREKYLLSDVPVGSLDDWMDADEADRAPILADVISVLTVQTGQASDDEGNRLHPHALALLDRAERVPAILERLSVSLRPGSWSGDYSTVLERRMRALEALEHDAPIVIGWRDEAIKQLSMRIVDERKREKEREQELQSFE